MVVDVKPGSGLIFRCPECKRVTNKGECKLHGRVEGVPDLRTKAVVDDGTNTLTAILNRELTEKIIGRNIDECIKLAKEAMNTERIADEISEKLTATPMQVRGNVMADEFGLTMIASVVEDVKVDVESDAKAMLDGLE